MNPIEGGDESFVMLNMIPLSMAGQVAEENNQDPKKKIKIYVSSNTVQKFNHAQGPDCKTILSAFPTGSAGHS